MLVFYLYILVFNLLVSLCVLFCRKRERREELGMWGGGEELGEVEGREKHDQNILSEFFSMKEKWGRKESTSPQ